MNKVKIYDRVRWRGRPDDLAIVTGTSAWRDSEGNPDPNYIKVRFDSDGVELVVLLEDVTPK